ncbi:MAG: hypothetical protein AAFV80_18080 [Bacteroidota bacterium]
MKKKPHQKESELNKVFSEFRERLHESTNPGDDRRYEVKKTKDGYTVIIHRERGANETIHFDSKAAVDAYLKGI